MNEHDDKTDPGASSGTGAPPMSSPNSQPNQGPQGAESAQGEGGPKADPTKKKVDKKKKGAMENVKNALLDADKEGKPSPGGNVHVQAMEEMAAKFTRFNKVLVRLALDKAGGAALVGLPAGLLAHGVKKAYNALKGKGSKPSDEQPSNEQPESLEPLEKGSEIKQIEIKKMVEALDEALGIEDEEDAQAIEKSESLDAYLSGFAEVTKDSDLLKNYLTEIADDPERLGHFAEAYCADCPEAQKFREQLAEMAAGDEALEDLLDDMADRLHDEVTEDVESVKDYFMELEDKDLVKAYSEHHSELSEMAEEDPELQELLDDRAANDQEHANAQQNHDELHLSPPSDTHEFALEPKKVLNNNETTDEDDEDANLNNIPRRPD